MKALRFTGTTLELADVEVPDAGSEVLVRVTASGICNTDLEIARGYAGFTGTIGHEFVGVVEVSGQRVVGEINAGCGQCEKCIAGDSRHCPTRTVLGIVGRDGSHAEFLSLPPKNLIAVPDSVTDEAAVFAEPLAAAMGIQEQVDIASDTRVAVIGDGKLGLLCSMALKLRTANVTLIGKHVEKMAIAEKRGVNGVQLDGLTAELYREFDVVVEASGSESGFATAVDLVRPRGKIVLKSTFHGTPTWPASRIVVDEITVVGSRCGQMRDAIDVLCSGAIDPREMITAEMALTDGVAAMERAAASDALKIILRP